MQTTKVLEETVVFLTQPSRLGSGITRGMLTHWTREGVLPRRRGKIISRTPVTLEWCLQGGQRVTSVEAYQRFTRKINGEDQPQ